MAHIIQIGAGSGGIVVLDLLSRDPRVTRVTLVEPDTYQSHNVYRHLFPATSVGRRKADLAAEWIRERRPDFMVDVLTVDVTDAAHQRAIEAAAGESDAGVCAADNEVAKYHFDQIMRRAGKPWVLGEVLSGGIAGWVHRFTPGGPCYGCVANYLQREAPGDPAALAPDYAHPGGAVVETTVPASKAAIDVIAGLHASVLLDLLGPEIAVPTHVSDFTSLLFTLRRVQGIFEEPYRAYKFRIPRSASCLLCSAASLPAGEDLDGALNQALARLGHD